MQDNKSLESEVEAKDEAPKKRTRRPRAPKANEAKPKEETQTTEEVETKAEKQPEPKAKPKADSPRIVKEGESIDVAVDEDGLATETVLREFPQPGTKRVSYIQVAIKGTHYQK